MSDRRWWAATAAGAPLTKHLLRSTGHALCGERRHSWQLVEYFAVPSVFECCDACVLIARLEAPDAG